MKLKPQRKSARSEVFAFSPDQLRWPKGTRWGGRWMDMPWTIGGEFTGFWGTYPNKDSKLYKDLNDKHFDGPGGIDDLTERLDRVGLDATPDELYLGSQELHEKAEAMRSDLFTRDDYDDDPEIVDAVNNFAEQTRLVAETSPDEWSQLIESARDEETGIGQWVEPEGIEPERNFLEPERDFSPPPGLESDSGIPEVENLKERLRDLDAQMAADSGRPSGEELPAEEGSWLWELEQAGSDPDKLREALENIRDDRDEFERDSPEADELFDRAIDLVYESLDALDRPAGGGADDIPVDENGRNRRAFMNLPSDVQEVLDRWIDSGSEEDKAEAVSYLIAHADEVGMSRQKLLNARMGDYAPTVAERSGGSAPQQPSPNPRPEDQDSARRIIESLIDDYRAVGESETDEVAEMLEDSLNRDSWEDVVSVWEEVRTKHYPDPDARKMLAEAITLIREGGRGGFSAETITASAGGELPSVEMFRNPNLKEVTPLTVTPEGRVYGHIASWDTCHIGNPEGPNRCTTPPRSATDYAYFHVGAVMTAEGHEVAVGKLVQGTTHADTYADAMQALAHYENTGLAVADVRAGEDAHGIWVSGVLRQNLTPAQLREFRAAPMSGDWRRIRGNLELVAALAVNIPGYPVPRPKGFVASGHMKTLVASGMVPPKTVKKPGTPGALSADDLHYLKSLADRERTNHAAQLAAKVKEVRMQDDIEKIKRFATSRQKEMK